MTAVAQTCSQCGWSFDREALQQNTCRKCKSAILVSSVAYLEKFDKPAIQRYIAQYSQVLRTDPQDRDALLAIGLCYLKLGLFDLADRFLRQLIDAHPADPSGYYYRAVCMLRGKRPRITSLSVMREAEQLIGTASELDPSNGRYEVVLAALRYDYYVLNGMRIPDPAPAILMANARTKHLDQLEIHEICRLIGITDGPVIQGFAR
jgi:tetratricopeptide (TPR) repeat protein